MKKNEIIEVLVLKGCKIEDISGLKIKKLRNMLDEEQKGDDSLILLDQVQETEESIIDTPIKNKNVIKKLDPKLEKVDEAKLVLSSPPVPTDSGWAQYVLSLFTDDELEGQNPRLEGLRRVTELLLGEVVEELCELVSSPNNENNERACAKATIIFADGRKVEALADACPSNCTKDFAMYPTAMADTRAKGRAYRTALRLKRVVAAEEIGTSKDEETDNPNKLINTGQITAIRLLADRLNISIKKLLDDLEISSIVKDGIIDLKSLKYGEGLIILNRLNNIRQEGVVQEKLKR